MDPIEINPNSKELVRGVAEFKEHKSRTIKYIRYAGKIINGKPTFIENVELPEDTDIIILIETEEIQKQ